MSDVLDRVRGTERGRAGRGEARSRPATGEFEVVAPLWARGAFAAGWAAAVGLAVLVVLSLVVWAAGSSPGVNAGGAMRFATVLWLAGHRTPLEVPDGTIAVAPLGLSLLLGLLLARATAIVARTSGIDDLGSVGLVVASVTAPYAVIATVLAVIARTGSIRPAVGAAFVTAAMFAAIASSVGALRGAGLTRVAWERVPLEVRTGCRAAWRASVVLLGGGLLLTAGATMTHLGAIGRIFTGYSSAPGELAVALISLLLAPNAVLFGASYLAGPGFAIGSGASVTMAGSHVSQVPALPVFAVVPHGAAGAPVLALCSVVLVAAGLAASWPSRINRPTPAEQLRTVLFCAAALLIGTTVVAALAGGPSGPGTLSTLGPSPWKCALAVMAEVSIVSLIVVACHAWIGQARHLLAGR